MADISAPAEQESGLQLDRRSALKIGAAGIAGVAVTSQLEPRKAEACPLLIAAGFSLFGIAMGWVFERVLDRLAGEFVDSATDAGVRHMRNTMAALKERPEKVILPKPRPPQPVKPKLEDYTPAVLAQRKFVSAHPVHDDTKDQFEASREIWTPEVKLIKYDNGRRFGMRELMYPVDRQIGSLAQNKYESETRGEYGGEPLIPRSHREISDHSQMHRDFRLGTRMYDLPVDLTYEDVAYVQRSVDVDGRPTNVFHLTAPVVDKLKTKLGATDANKIETIVF